ncbi:MAG: acetyl-CoA decarbonylase/synthase complex subunit gamma [Candidatus Omnitrophica bacterium]|nr:acetyl-CoA decarbonylase/synthase complex subunit gamma [Candidatus Omnitrophota bacterium]
MALSGLDIYKLLPKTNCRECGFPACLAFAMQLARKAERIDKCPYLSKESKEVFEAQALPPIKLITLGEGEDKLEIGNESVIFRHEEKFHHPCGIGIIIQDSLSKEEIEQEIAKINSLRFERVGQKIQVNLIAVEAKAGAGRFIEAVKTVSQNTKIALALMNEDPEALKAALSILKGRRPLIYSANENNLKMMAGLAKDYGAVLAVSVKDLDSVVSLTTELNNLGCLDLVLEIKGKSITDRIWDLTQIRRLALKKNNRALGYPVLTVIEESDSFEEAQEAATYISKYAGNAKYS